MKFAILAFLCIGLCGCKGIIKKFGGFNLNSQHTEAIANEEAIFDQKDYEELKRKLDNIDTIEFTESDKQLLELIKDNFLHETLHKEDFAPFEEASE